MPITAENPLKMSLFKFELLKGYPKLIHGISTRHAPQNPLWPEVQPESPNEYKIGGANLGLADEVILKRRAELLAACGGDWEKHFTSLTSGYQVHSANVAAIGPEAYGAGLTWRNSIPETDGLVTDLSGLPLLTGHADCPPILFYDPLQKVIGAAHSGWRGTVSKIGGAMVRVMVEKYGCQPANILAGIGPSIGACCYTFGGPGIAEIEQAFGQDMAEELLPLQPDGSHTFDLWTAIRYTLLEAGLKPENIESSELCSQCYQDTFFSYRATSPEMRGRQGNYAALIMLV